MNVLPYQAIVFDMWVARGNFDNTGELGRYPMELVNDKTWGELIPSAALSSDVANIRDSDDGNGFIFGWLSRMPYEYGGLEFKGGLVVYTRMPFEAVREGFDSINVDVIKDSDQAIMPYHLLYLNNLPEDPRDQGFNLVKVITTAANIYYNGPIATHYIPGTNFSLS
jgi:hypothetical protein